MVYFVFVNPAILMLLGVVLIIALNFRRIIVGTLIGVTHRTGLIKNGTPARMTEALISDSLAIKFAVSG